MTLHILFKKVAKTEVTISIIVNNIIVIVEDYKTNFVPLAILFHFLCAQHVSDKNVSIIRSL